MSDYGLKTINSDGGIQIDSIYRNLSLDESGDTETITNGNYVFSSYYTCVSLTSSTLVPLILMRPNTDRFISVKNYHKTNDNFDRVDIITEANSDSAISTEIDWRSYRENRTVSEESYGLLVYNANGDLCFDSGKRYFKIHSVHSIALDSPVDGDIEYGDYEDITHSGISNPFYLLSPASIYVTFVFFNPPNYYYNAFWSIGMKKLTSTSVRVGWFRHRLIATGGAYSAVGVNPTMKLLVCDVT